MADEVALIVRLRVQRNILVERLNRQVNVLLNSALPIQLDVDLVNDINYMTYWIGDVDVEAPPVELNDEERNEVEMAVQQAEAEAVALETECSICWEQIDGEDYVCGNGHRFHLGCIQGMLERNRVVTERTEMHIDNVCPMCREPIRADVVADVIGDRLPQVFVQDGVEMAAPPVDPEEVARGVTIWGFAMGNMFLRSIYERFYSAEGEMGDNDFEVLSGQYNTFVNVMDSGQDMAVPVNLEPRKRQLIRFLEEFCGFRPADRNIPKTPYLFLTFMACGLLLKNFSQRGGADLVENDMGMLRTTLQFVFGRQVREFGVEDLLIVNDAHEVILRWLGAVCRL